MNRQKFILLGAVTVGLVVLALVMNIIQRREYTAAPMQRFLPELEAHLNDITRLQVQGAGSAPVTIELRDNRWQVAEKAGYPVDLGLLRQQLFTLARLERVEAMTRNPDKYDRLGLQPVDKAGSEAREIRLWAGDKELARLEVGKTGTGGGSYMRLANDPQTWLTSARVAPPTRAEDWLNKDVISLAPDRLYRIEVKPVEGSAYSLTKADPKASDFTLDPPAEEGKPLKPGELHRIATALSALRLDDVMPAKQMPAGEGPWNNARFETFDGLVVEAQSRKLDNHQYLKLNAHFDEDLAKRLQQLAQGDPAAAKPPTETLSSIPTLQPPDQVKAAAAQLQSRFDGWVYVVPDYKASLFSQSRDTLFEKQAALANPPADEAHPEDEASEPATENEEQPGTKPGSPTDTAPAKPEDHPSAQQ